MDILGFLNDNDDAYVALHICYFSIATIKRCSRLGVRLGPLSYLYVCGRHQTSPPPCPVKGKRSCRVRLGRNAIVYKQLQEKKTMCTSRTQNVRTIRSMCSFVTHRLEEKDKSIAKRIKDNGCRGYHSNPPHQKHAQRGEMHYKLCNHDQHTSLGRRLPPSEKFPYLLETTCRVVLQDHPVLHMERDV